MACCKKVIYEITLLDDQDGDSFMARVKNKVVLWQDAGYEVDIQFAANNSQALAFMTKYKMEPI